MPIKVTETHSSRAGYSVGVSGDSAATHRTTIETIDEGLLATSRPLHRPAARLPAPMTREAFRKKFNGQAPPDAWFDDAED